MDFLVHQGGRFVQAPHTTGSYRSPKLPEIHLDLRSFWRQAERRLDGVPLP
jgi:hypothetical protein